MHIGHYLPEVEIRDCNVMIDGKNFFDQPVKTDIRTYDNIRKLATGQGVITQPVACWIKTISISTINDSNRFKSITST